MIEHPATRPAVSEQPSDPAGSLAAARRALHAGQSELALSWCERAVRLGADAGDREVVIAAAMLLPPVGSGRWAASARQRALAEQALQVIGSDDSAAADELRAVIRQTANPWTARPAVDGTTPESGRRRPTPSPAHLRARHADLLDLGDVHLRLDLADDMMAAGARIGDDDVVATGRSWRLDALGQLGRRGELEAELLDAEGFVERMGRPWWTWWLLSVRAALAQVDGDHVEALRQADSAAEFGIEHGIAEAHFVHLVLQTRVALRTGSRLDEVEAQVGESVRRAPLSARGWHAQLLAAQGKRHDVEIIWRTLASQLTSVPRRAPEWVIATAGHASLALYLGDRASAATLVELLGSVDGLCAVGPVHTPGHGPVALHLGLLAELMGDTDVARSHLERASAQADAAFTPDFAADARAALARLAGTGSVLTRRELEIASLVARGETNSQIGRALFVSERTVESHVSSILRKLDLPTRTAAAAWVIRQGSEPT